MGLLGCNDTRNYLKDYNYGTIALPREGIKPLLMLIKSGNALTRLGPLASTFLPGGVPLPTSSRNRSAGVSGSKSRGIDASIGLDLLGKIIGALSGSTLGIKAAYKNARKVEFEFGDVTEEAVDITALDQYLSGGSVAGNTGNFIRDALERDEVYVIVSTLDARQVSVDATGSGNASIGLDVPVIQQIVGAKIAVSGDAANTSKITYTTTDIPLSFGLQVVRLVFTGGKYTTLKTVAPGDARGGLVARPRPAIVGPDVPIEL